MNQISSQWIKELCRSDFSIKRFVYRAIQLLINLNAKGVNNLLLLVFLYEIIAIGIAIWRFQKREEAMHLQTLFIATLHAETQSA